jgi:mannose-1-phosphate guanylyltransferase
MRLFPVIMAGGSGTRFWPLSRRARPKQFLPLASEAPLIVDTFARLKGLASPKDTWVVCGKAHAPLARRALRAVPKGNVLVEPAARNTAPAIGLACVHALRKDPQAVLAVLPSDHHVADVPEFQRLLRLASAAAEGGDIVTLGVAPSRPETGYGYIRLGPPRRGEVRAVRAFVEKPDLATANGYLASGEYAWNAGIFVFRADVMMQAFADHLPQLHRGLAEIGSHLGRRTYPQALGRIFPKLPSISIDYGVAEKVTNIAVIPGRFGWSDVGSFAAIPEVRPADAAGNVVSGKGAVILDSQGCVVLVGQRPVAVVGARDLVVVDAGDAILVVPKHRTQDVRQAVEALEKRRLERHL